MDTIGIGLKNLLVIGASGQLGKALWREVRADNDIQPLGTSFRRGGNGTVFMDITSSGDSDEVFDLFRPDTVILSSSLTSVDNCEQSPAEARKINTDGVRVIKEHCDRSGASLVFLSSDYVFDGTSGPNRETDPVNPLNVYGQTKLAAEKIALEAKNGCLVVRTNTLYNYDPDSLNFVMQIINSHRRGGTMRVPSDQYATPTYAPDLARIILEMVRRELTGIYHVCGPDNMSRHRFALEICSELGFNPDFITPVATPELRQRAVRPLRAGLLSEKLINETGIHPWGIKQGLADIRIKMESPVTA